MKFLLAALCAVLFISSASAQSQRNPCYYPSASPGTSSGCIPVSTTNPLPTSASATITGGFTDAATGTPISVTTGGVTGTLPTGSVVVATNVGTTNGAYCKLGASATTSDQYLSPNGGWFAFSVGANTQLTCITSTSTTTVNMTGGSGLPTGTGGGGGGSGGGTSSSYGSAFPATGTAIGFTDGTNMVSAKVRNPGSGATTADPAIVVSDANVVAAINNPTPACSAAPCLTTIGNVGFDPSSGVQAPSMAFLALPATTTTQIIALSGSTKTYVTSRILLAGGSVNVTFKYGTGSNCGTGTTTLDGPWPLTAQAGFAEGAGVGPVMIVPAGQALCVTTDASVSGGVKLTYMQK